MKKDMEARLAAKQKMIPKKGINLVGLDDYQRAGEELYLIGNYPDEASAKKAQEARKKKNPTEVTFIYNSTTK